MRLEDLTPEMFLRALDLYLEVAYGDAPYTLPPGLDVTHIESAQEVLSLFHKEFRPTPDGANFHHYVLRLGNDRYPHMKLALMEFLEPGTWVWAVDTHDRVAVSESSPDWPKWQELRIHNLTVKANVEAKWRGAGLDTCRVVASRMPKVAQAEAGPLILVVDDEAGMRSAAVNILRGEGYRVVEAGDGVEAIERFVESRPDLVLMDYEMPTMDGVELCRRLRELPSSRARATPMLIATAGMADLSTFEGLDGFLVKPYQRTLLLSFVKHQLPGDKGGSGPSLA